MYSRVGNRLHQDVDGLGLALDRDTANSRPAANSSFFIVFSLSFLGTHRSPGSLQRPQRQSLDQISAHERQQHQHRRDGDERSPRRRSAISTPRWVWKLASPTGSVLVCLPVSMSANRNSFQLRMKPAGRPPAGRAPRPARRSSQKAWNRVAPSTRAACSSCAMSPWKKATSIQARNGMLMVRCAMISAGPGVDQAGQQEHRVQRQHQDHRRQHLARQHEEPQRHAAGVEAGKGIGHRRRQRQRDRGRADSRDDAVQEVAGEIVLGEDLDEVVRAEAPPTPAAACRR